MSQGVFDLDKASLGLHEARAYGLVGNPVYLAALLVGGLWMLYHQTDRLAVAATLTFVFAAALQLSGTRSAIALVMVGVVVAATKDWRRVAVLLVVTVLGLGAGAAVAATGAATSGTERLADPSLGGFRSRTEAWISATHAVGDRPMLGAGPGRYAAATTRYKTLAFSRAEGPARFFADAHNIVVEYAVTTGLVGVLLFIGWVLLAIRNAGPRSPLGAAAVGILLLHLVEPQSVSTTPVAFLALGVAGPPLMTELGRRWRVAVAGSAMAAVVAGGALSYGFFAFNQASLDYSHGWALTADRFLPYWGEPKSVLGRIAALRALETREHRYTVEALRQRRAASAADPSDQVALEALATFEIQLGQRAAAARHLARVLELDPWAPNSLNLLGRLLIEDGDSDHALVLLRRSLQVYPDQPGTRVLVDRLETASTGTR